MILFLKKRPKRGLKWPKTAFFGKNAKKHEKRVFLKVVVFEKNKASECLFAKKQKKHGFLQKNTKKIKCFLKNRGIFRKKKE